MKHLARISAFLPLAVTLVWLQFLPNRVPMHYDFNGNIDRWGSKWENLLLPGIVLLMGLIFLLTEKLGSREAAGDEKNSAHAASNRKVLRIIMIATALFFTVLQAVLLYGAGRAAANGAAQSELPLNRVTVICLGLMILVLGNYMPRAKLNSTVGFRCGWTMHSDVTWQRSNRFSGYAMMATGALSVIAALLVPDAWTLPLFFGFLTLSVILSLLYARRVYREEIEKE